MGGTAGLEDRADPHEAAWMELQRAMARARRLRLVEMENGRTMNGVASWPVQECKAALRAWLADGPVPIGEIEEMAEHEGFDRWQLDVAADALGVLARKGRWRLPD